jgi:REP element-mobilizing transposase RayT
MREITMGRNRYRIFEEQKPHFLTCTVLNWIPVFTRTTTTAIILDALEYRQRELGWKIYGYVILENHLHLVVQTHDLRQELPQFKSFTARKLIDHLQECRAERVLKQLVWFRKRHKQDREHQFWEEGSHPQAIESEDALRQKLEYIHNNPVKRGYVDNQIHWRYSSARNYAGEEGLIPVFKEWL